MNATLASITAYKKYGLGRNLVRHFLEKEFSIPKNIRDAYSRYYILYWSGHYVLEKLKDGVIFHDGIKYFAYLEPRLSRSILANHSEKQFAVSFRMAQPEFELPAIVIIKNPQH